MKSNTTEGLRSAWTRRAKQKQLEDREPASPEMGKNSDVLGRIRPQAANATEQSNRPMQADVLPSTRQTNYVGGSELDMTDVKARDASRIPPQLSIVHSLDSFGLGETVSADRRLKPQGGVPSHRSSRDGSEQRSSSGNATGFAGLVSQVMGNDHAAKQQALLRMYAAVSQDAKLAQIDARSSQLDGFFRVLEAGLPQFIKAVAVIVLRTDRNTLPLVRKMAAAVLKALARWVEANVALTSKPDPFICEALDAVLIDGAPSSRQPPAASVRLDQQDSLSQGYGNLLDTDALEGLLDGEGAAAAQDAQRPYGAMMDTHHMFGSLMETGTLERLLHHNRPVQRSTLSTQVLSSHGSLDMTGHILKYKGSLRALLWLFKTDLPDAWYTAASFVGSIALQGNMQVEAMGGARLIKPLMWLLRHGSSEHRLVVCRALAELSKSPTCSHIISQRDKHLKLIAQVSRSKDAKTKLVAIKLANILLGQEPGTHWIFSRCGMVSSLLAQLKDPTANAETKAEAVNSLKHLTSASQTTREEVIKLGGVKYLCQLLQGNSVDAQYSAARVLRHLAMSGDMPERVEILEAIPYLVQGLEGRPRVSFACAAALAMLMEGTPSACSILQARGGIKALLHLLNHAGTQGKKVAAEALQALAAEDVSCRQEISQTRSLLPLVDMLANGSLQQQAAAAGTVQALAFCPAGASSLPEELRHQPIVHHLVALLQTAPKPMQCAAAGALCNLALGAEEAQALVEVAGGVQALTELLRDAQPDGQYSAAATLVNLSCSQHSVLPFALELGVVTSLLLMLSAKSWYCRIVAADLLLRLAIAPDFSASQLSEANCTKPLLELLQLQKTVKDASEEQLLEVAHLAYERSHEVIVMKGYRFHRAKLVATLAIGHLSFQYPGSLLPAPDDLEAMSLDLKAMLDSSLQTFKSAACAAIADLCRSSRSFVHIIKKMGIVEDLCTILRDTLGGLNFDSADVENRLWWTARFSARAILEACKQDDEVTSRAISTGLFKNLASKLKLGLGSQAADCVLLFFHLFQVSGTQKSMDSIASNISHPQAIHQANLQTSACSALQTLILTIGNGGYAVTAKPSANLYILLQVPFQVLLPTDASMTTPRRNTSGSRSIMATSSSHALHENGSGVRSGWPARGPPATAVEPQERRIMETWTEHL